jgi:CheY-like chemotaxis protein
MPMIIVLIIEDNPDLAAFMKLSIEHATCKVLTAQTRDEALDLVRILGTPHTIIMDWHMPGMGVEKFLFELALMSPHLPRLVLTTAGNDADEAARQFSIAEVLRKPFRDGDLLAQVDGYK